MAGASVFVELKMSLDKFKASMGEAKSEITKLEKHQGSTLEKVSAFGKGAMLGVAGAAVGIGGMAIEMADKQEIAQKQLEASLKASGTSWESVKDKVKQTGDEATKYGFTQEQIDSAMNLGVISTQNYGKAHDNLKVAIDLAAAKHVDLTTAMAAVDKAATGNTMALKKLGIDLPIVAGGAKKVAAANDALSKAQDQVTGDMQAGADMAAVGSKAHNKYEADVAKVEAAHKKLTSAQQAGNNVLDALKQRLSGQADAAADTFAGKLAAAKAQATNLGAEIGDKLMPVISKLMTGIEGAVKWLEKHKTIAIALGIVIGTVLVAAIGTYIATQVIALAATVATGVGAMATGVMMAAAWLLALGPIGLLIVAVTAIVGVFILLYKHSQLVREIVATIGHAFKAAFDFVLDIVKGAVEFIKTHWELILAIITGPIGLIVLFIKDHFDQIKQIVMGVIDAVVGFFTALPGRIVGALGDIVGTVFGALSGAWTWIKKNVYDPIVEGFMGLPGAIGSAVGGALNGMAGIGTTIINDIIKGLNVVIDTVDTAIGKINFFGIGLPKHLIPNIPQLAMGGPLGAGQMALVGEQGPELFVPSSAGQIIPHGQFGAGGGAAAAGPVYLQIDGKTFATLMLPSLQTTVLQAQRTSSVNIFGSAA